MASTPTGPSRPSTKELRFRESLALSSDGEDSPRSYCEVLQSGTPSVHSMEVEVEGSPRPQGVRRLASVVMSAETAAAGGLEDLDGRRWLPAGKLRKRRRNMAPLPTTVVREELANLAGRCFNRLAEDHVDALCPNATRLGLALAWPRILGRRRLPARLARLRLQSPRSRCPAGCCSPRPAGCARSLLVAAAANPRPGLALLVRLVPRVVDEKAPAPAPGQAPGQAPTPAPAPLTVSSPALTAAPPPLATAREAVDSLPLGAASLRPRVGICIIPRSPELEAEERALQWSAVVLVTGVRSRLALTAVGRVIASRFPELDGCYSTHRIWPDGLLVIFNSRGACDAVLATGSIDGRGFFLRFSAWNRFCQAVGRTTSFRVHLEIEGVPPHAWSSSTAAAILGPACAVERVGSNNAGREDHGRFDVYAWTSDPCLIPRETWLQIPEAPVLEDDAEDDLVVPPELLIPLEVRLLEYNVLVHLLRVEDATSSSDGPSSDEWPSDGGVGGHNGDSGRGYGDQQPARGTRQNFFSYSRGRVDEDDFGDHPGGSRRRSMGGHVALGRSSTLSAEAPEFRPASSCLSRVPDPMLEWLPSPTWAADRWDPMRMEVVSPPSSPSLVGSSLDLPPINFEEVSFEEVRSQEDSSLSVEGWVLSTFTVCLSDVALPSPVRWVSNVEPTATASCEVEAFRTRVRRKTSLVLARPVHRRPRRKVVQHYSPRRSKRLAGQGTASVGTKRQQRVLMHKLGVKREGDKIGEEALQSYIQLFDRLLSPEHITAILSLFGWENTALPLEEGSGVEVLE
ncbi:uncharacterized protein LOC106866373 [Brachypodium distachyon]|uniref:uncharacterized protein LOC106866373 n=1 Tax=Brachypodium distachyon TaxID=15368 RepID=UPI00071CF35C|nr:uncharacterized protein LOC106866373 [Brachypodium distachyon]|eukprot:XP_014755961.1 uncharacterized protein LOC106866373 [Brachypodium distachyon]